jgi:hypothetical protein
MPNITNYQKNANKSQNGISPHFSEEGYYRKRLKIISAEED